MSHERTGSVGLAHLARLCPGQPLGPNATEPALPRIRPSAPQRSQDWCPQASGALCTSRVSKAPPSEFPRGGRAQPWSTGAPARLAQGASPCLLSWVLLQTRHLGLGAWRFTQGSGEGVGLAVVQLSAEGCDPLPDLPALLCPGLELSGGRPQGQLRSNAPCGATAPLCSSLPEGLSRRSSRSHTGADSRWGRVRTETPQPGQVFIAAVKAARNC